MADAVIRLPHSTLHRGDCLKVLRSMPEGSVDAVITDPPYNVGFEYGSTDDRRADYAGWCGEWFSECRRVCRGPVLVSCGIVNLGMWYGIARPDWVLCWHKPATMGRSWAGFNNWEPVLAYGKLRGRGGCDVFSAPIRPDRRLDGHPCPKPLKWGTWLVGKMTLPGDRILDPFMGSGTTAVACRMLGREFTGVELDPGYLELARSRVESTPWGARVGFGL